MNEDSHADHIYAGDPRYDGFRIEELWIFTLVNPNDNQEGLITTLDGRPFMVADRRMLDDLTRAVRESGVAHGAVVKHFKLVDSETL